MALNNNNMPNFNNMNLNQNAYNAYQNMFNNNPTFGMFNQMQLNQLLMNYVQNNPNLFFNNNPNPINQQSFQAFQPGGNMNYMGTGVKGGNIPRPNQANQRIFQNIDSYPGYNGPRINVIFETSTGIRVNIPTPVTESVQGLLNKFCQRVGINPSLLKKEIVCVYNATYMNPFNTISIQQFFKQNLGLNEQAKIMVIDAQNIIGA